MKKVAPACLLMTMATVGTDRVVRWMDVHPDYSARTEPGAISPRSTILAGSATARVVIPSGPA